MGKLVVDPFVTVRIRSSLGTEFKTVRDEAGYAPARAMIRETFSNFVDADGNFLEQFQTTAFSPRLWELYLHAYFSEAGFAIVRPERPDFLLDKEGARLAVEAVTTNPTQGAPESDPPVTHADIANAQLNYVPIRLGGALIAKLRHRYWEVPDVVGHPLVIAIESFHGPDALDYSDAALSTYLFGKSVSAGWDQKGQLQQILAEIDVHKDGTKEIPSGFFDLPDAEHISAVLFSNSGTIAKFLRIGQEGEFWSPDLLMWRLGYCHDSDPQAATPIQFEYVVGSRPDRETWGEGLSMIHNPHAVLPLDRSLFPTIAHTRMDEQGLIMTETPEFYPFSSKTLTIHILPGDPEPTPDQPAESPNSPLLRVSREMFDRFGFPRPPTTLPWLEASEYYMDRRGRVFGMLVLDHSDEDWSWVVLGRDTDGVFKAVEFDTSHADSGSALKAMTEAMERLLASDQTVFPQK